MKLNELRYGEHFSCRFEPYSNPDDKSNKLVDNQNPLGVVLQKNQAANDAYVIQFGTAPAKMVRLIGCSDLSAFENRLFAAQTNLFEVTNILSCRNQIDVEVVFFREYKSFPNDFHVTVTKELEDKDNAASAKKTNFSKKEGEDLCGIMQSKFTLGTSSNPYFLFMGNSQDTCTLVNPDYQLKIKVGKINEETVLFATGLKKHKPRNTENSVCLAKGKLKFSYLSPEKISNLNAQELKKNLDEGTSYIGEWDKYNSEIGKRLLESARNAGYAVISGKPEKISNHEISFHISISENGKEHGNFESLSENDKLDIIQELPDYLKNPKMSYEDWIDGIDKKLETENTSTLRDKEEEKKEKEEKKWSNLTITERTDNTITIHADKKGLPERGKNGELYFILSVVGDKTQVVRRRRARKNILDGKSQISNLGLILDGKESINSNIPQNSGNKKKISDRQQKKIYEKIFEYEPTDNQKQAIDIALTTPDIAVIQGPPGTGKTTVICGIIESLNESFQKDNNIAGKIFVTSLQHDAVHNIVKRLSVNALPTVKFGRASNEDDLSLSATEENIHNWCEETAKNIESKLPAIIESAEFRKLKSLFLDYKKAPSVSIEKELLTGIKNLSSRFTTPLILEKIGSIMDTINDNDSKDREEIVSCLYALRTEENSFLDDGQKRALELFVRLREEQISVPKSLEKAMNYSAGENLDFLGDLENWKNQLLEEYIPSVELRREKENLAITEIVNEVSERIQQYPFDPAEKKNMALADFVYELRNNPDGIKNTLLGYNPVFAATVQQGEGKEINETRKQLGLDDENKITPYEYIIVDEAARVTPPDLLIPMSKGKHIILVGDHRQLPQQIDQDIEKKLESAAASRDEINFLKESTFERLFAQLDVKKKITLNKQYRMHPVLGNFISKEFYSDSEGFESPLGPEKFPNNLPYIANKAAIWCDVPNEQSGNGAESKDNLKSRYRRGEAIIAAQLLNKWLKNDSEKKLTFGLISFYSAQCREIKKQLKSLGICICNDDGELEIKDEYKYTSMDEKKEKKERIRIGTVDAFQGMEFDVAILCAVRTSSEAKIKSANTELQKNAEEGLRRQQTIFGFLMSKNRLCVSMSRQKKALVVVGDKNLFASELAKESVPGLYDYLKMCERDKEYGLVLEGKLIMET